MKDKIKAVLFDFGNVLGYFSHQRACKRLANYIPDINLEILRKQLFTGSLVTARQTGNLKPNEFYQSLLETFHLHQSCDFNTFAELWGDIFSPAPQEILHVLGELKSETITCIATNTEALHWRYVERLKTVQLLTGRKNNYVFRSYEMGYEKPQSAFFTYLLKEIKLLPEETLFIDDIFENTQTYNVMGGRTEVFNLKTDNPQVLRDILNNYGVLK
jgi:putative hydrolase of the HAD superfamily